MQVPAAEKVNDHLANISPNKTVRGAFNGVYCNTETFFMLDWIKKTPLFLSLDPTQTVTMLGLISYELR